MSVTNLNAIQFEKLDDTPDGDREAISLYLHMEKFKKESGQNFSVWAHKMACRFNDPANKAGAAARFRAHCEDLVRYACSPSLDSAIRQDPKKFKLDNNSAFAQAFKALHGAMELGADLKHADFDTVSKCKKWVKQEKDRIAEEARVAAIEDYLKSAGIDRNSEEGKRLLGLPPGDGPTDPIGISMANLEASLREHAKYAPEGQGVEMVEALIKRVDESTAKMIESINAKAAAQATGTHG